MAKRVKSTKIGDIFAAPIDENYKRYIQYIISDLYQLNCDVIRAFKKKYLISENPDLSDIVSGEVDFYTHSPTKFGIKLDVWELVGNHSEIGRTDHMIFRSNMDPKKMYNIDAIGGWRLWKLDDQPQWKVQKLEGEDRNSEPGYAYSPLSVLVRLKTGEYY